MNAVGHELHSPEAGGTNRLGGHSETIKGPPSIGLAVTPVELHSPHAERISVAPKDHSALGVELLFGEALEVNRRAGLGAFASEETGHVVTGGAVSMKRHTDGITTREKLDLETRGLGISHVVICEPRGRIWRRGSCRRDDRLRC